MQMNTRWHSVERMLHQKQKQPNTIKVAIVTKTQKYSILIRYVKSVTSMLTAVSSTLF